MKNIDRFLDKWNSIQFRLRLVYFNKQFSAGNFKFEITRNEGVFVKIAPGELEPKETNVFTKA